MQKVLTADQMREVDRLTTERYGIPSILLMENAAHAVARVITEKLGGSVKGKSILILCGPGNNGGDGAAVARILERAGAITFTILVGKIENTKGDARINFEILQKLGSNGSHDLCQISDLTEEVSHLIRSSGFVLVVDAFFGTGLTRPIGGTYEDVLLDLIEIADVPVISVDIPSGINADLSLPIGRLAAPSVTVTFTAPKPATVLPPTSDLCGEVVVSDIGSPRELIDEQPSQLFLAEREDAVNWLGKAAFSSGDYKNKRGHALIVAGSESYSGAAVLVGDAAMRSGVGLVTIATPKSSKDSIAARVLPEVMVKGVAETESGAVAQEAFDELHDLFEKADAVAIGSGLSQDESTRKFVQKVIEYRKSPIVVDADALNLISPFRGEALGTMSGPPVIFTPHEGEFMRLLGTTDKDKIKDRVAAVRNFSREHNVILVLKGERVLIGHPDGRVVVNPTGNSGLGKAGNGDTLTGILAGFVAQAAAMDIDIFETVVAAVYIAGMAGDIAEKKFGKRVMTASDVRECLVDVFDELTTH